MTVYLMKNDGTTNHYSTKITRNNYSIQLALKSKARTRV